MCTLIKIGRISWELRSVKDGHPCFVLCILNLKIYSSGSEHLIKIRSLSKKAKTLAKNINISINLNVNVNIVINININIDIDNNYPPKRR